MSNPSPPWARAIPVAALVASLGGNAWAQSGAGEPQAYMRKIGFPEGEIADLKGGKVVARVFPDQQVPRGKL